MNRRAFMGALAGLPFIGKILKTEPPEQIKDTATSVMIELENSERMHRSLELPEHPVGGYLKEDIYFDDTPMSDWYTFDPDAPLDWSTFGGPKEYAITEGGVMRPCSRETFEAYVKARKV